MNQLATCFEPLVAPRILEAVLGTANTAPGFGLLILILILILISSLRGCERLRLGLGLRLRIARLAFGAWAVLAAVAPGTVCAQSTGPPFIQIQPQDQTNFAGASAVFNVLAIGKTPLFYQWFKSTGLIPDATNAVLKLPMVDEPDSGTYFVVVSNSISITRST